MELNIIEKDFKNKKEDVLYKSCCGFTSDKRLILLLFQISLSSILVVFAVIQMYLLNNTNTCESEKYNSLLLTLIGYWFGKKF